MSIKPYEKPVAVLDIGSNSVRLDIRFNASPSAPVLVRRRSLCRLGKLTQKGNLAKTRMQYALNRLKKFAHLIKSNDVDIYRAVATAAIRDANNGQQFLDMIKKETGLNIEPISGEEEANLMAVGVISTFSQPISGVIADLGGGSLELVQVKNSQIKSAASLPIGIHKFKDAGKESEKVIREKISEISWLKNCDTIYIVGGSWRACARLDMNNRELPTKNVQGYSFKANEVAKICDWLMTGKFKMEVDEEDIEQHRVKEIPVAALILKVLASLCGNPQVIVSSGGVREGVFIELVNQYGKKAA